ncbi:DUF1499 domain-containing protein [Roseisalinus antarcticus]|uniref:DUF1499 domain-containing protein n=1 Tax=Roseisalinus antarcticus TaxID=254357 RepID=A0A1Y5RMG2_9RHOB|nr:DUF1499 domain-containing protein [Roseisalinus antarcticus]SLN18245.1 hypothetical protein ROA7023_00384 [Roseisalinus antarcticus]
MRTIIFVLVLLAVAGLAYIRLAPSDPERWHVDPSASSAPGRGGWKVAPEGGNQAAPVWAADPAEVLAAVDAVAMATPRTTRLAGSVADGRISYVTRTRIMGFPDYTTVTARSAPGGATLTMLARQRFGSDDLGVNRARLEGWLAALSDRLDQAGPT